MKSKELYESPVAEIIHAIDVSVLCMSGCTEEMYNGNSGGIFEGSEGYGNGSTEGWF